MHRHDSANRVNEKSRFKSIDDFKIIEEIGRGGYSVVYLVRHVDSGKKYALKCGMKYKKGKDRSRRTREEIKVLDSLKHKNIIRLKGWFEDEDNIYLVLPYIQGWDLSKYLREDLPSIDDVVYIILQVVEALKYCHQKGVIHRDLKLENILVRKDLSVKIIDFGLCAVKSDPNDIFDDDVGTTRYTSPEMLAGDGYNESVDVWGIGIILFVLLTGRYPFDGSKRRSVFRRISNKHIDYDKYDLSSLEIHLLKRLLCKNPQYRIRLEKIETHPWFQSHGSYSDSYESED